MSACHTAAEGRRTEPTTDARATTKALKPTASHPLYLGRFAFTAPPGLSGSVDEAVLDGVQIRPVRWPVDSTPAEVWAAQVHAVEADPALRPPGVAATMIAQQTPAPGTYLLYRYASSAIPTARMAEALVVRGPATLSLQVPYAPGYERQVENAVAEVGRAYTTSYAQDAAWADGRSTSKAASSRSRSARTNRSWPQ